VKASHPWISIFGLAFQDYSILTPEPQDLNCRQKAFDGKERLEARLLLWLGLRLFLLNDDHFFLVFESPARPLCLFFHLGVLGSCSCLVNAPRSRILAALTRGESRRAQGTGQAEDGDYQKR